MIENLIFGCPHHHPKDFCPFQKYRKMKYIQALNEISKLSPEEKAEMEQFHHQCCLFRDAYVFSKKYD
jgi:hypothetical protein